MNMHRTFAVAFCFLSLLVAGVRGEEFQDDVELVAQHREITKTWVAGGPTAPIEEEVQRLSKIFEKDQQNWTALRLLTFCNLWLEKDAEVERHLPTLLKNTPQHAWVHILSAQFYDRRKGEVERPIMSLENAILLLPEKTEREKLLKVSVMTDLANLYRKQGAAREKESTEKASLSYDNGLNVVQNALKLLPNDLFVQMTAARLCLQGQRYEGCIRWATKTLDVVQPLLQNDPLYYQPYSEALLIRGEAHLRAGRKMEARLDLGSGLAIMKRIGAEERDKEIILALLKQAEEN